MRSPSKLLHIVARACSAIFAMTFAEACNREQYSARLATGDEVKIVRAIKGNDIVVAKGDQLARVRLVGVYAFDPNVREKSDIQVWADSAAAFMTRHKDASVRVVLEREELDPKGRHLGFLERAGVDLGKQLIEEGHGAAYTEYPFSREADYLRVDTLARENVRGLWGGAVARKRLHALRQTWATVRTRNAGAPSIDPLLAGEDAR